MRRWSILMLALAASCAAPSPSPSPTSPPPAPPAPPPPPVAAAPPLKDACGAASLQSLVGRPRTEIPVPVNPGLRRVVCSTCPMTQDYVPARQTIIYDSQTGSVTAVRCG